MLFTSYEFLGFLLALFPLYYVVPRRAQWLLLLAASYLFYWCADPQYLLSILATTATTYATTCLIQRNLDGQKAYIRMYKEELNREENRHTKPGSRPYGGAG